MRLELASIGVSVAAMALALAAWRRIPAAEEGGRAAPEGQAPLPRRTVAAQARDAGLAANAAALRKEVVALEAAALTIDWVSNAAGSSGGAEPAGLRAEIEQEIAELKAERRTSAIDGTIRTLRLTFRHNVAGVAAPFGLTEAQQERWNEILERQAEAARGVLEAETRGPEHDARAKALVEETHRLLAEVLDGEQLKKYRKSPIDWFGGSLHSATPGR